LPSHRENFGNAVAEAMAAELPVIVSRHVDLWPDIIDYGAGAVTGDGPDEIAEGILGLLASYDLRQIGRNGRRLVTERYSNTIVTSQMIDYYAEAIRSA
jgi:glycosyltransferase involved in cell wall biosynthesis